MKLRQLIRLNGHQTESLTLINRSNTFSHPLNSNDDDHNQLPIGENGGIKGFFKTASPTFLKRAIHNRTLDKFQKLKRSLSSHEITKKEIEKQQEPVTKPVIYHEPNRLFRTHSYTHNFDNDIKEIKEDYATILAELCGKSKDQQNWVRINMIDFTHVFHAEDNDFDNNYLEGLENLIKLLERFLARVIKRN